MNKSVIAWACLLVALLVTQSATAKRIKSEDEHNRAWCAEMGGRAEVINNDKTRVDCLTLGYAIEADFADKWYEAIGQAVHYSRMQGRFPGVLLIVERPEHCAKVRAALLAIWHIRVKTELGGMMPIRFWVVGDKICHTKKVDA